MDFLDPKKQRRQQFMLRVGYCFIGVALIFSLRILYLVAHGYALDKNGQVVQDGFLYVSSTPTGAQIGLSGVTSPPKTNTRLTLPGGTYQMTINRSGYRTWRGAFNLEGDSVLRYDYPFLVPTTLTTTPVKTYDAAPALATQSPDRRWLLVLAPGSDTEFDVYDLKSPTAPQSKLSLPTNLLSSGTAQSWALMEWADDNKHVLLSRTADNKTDFILVDRTDATKSLNLNQTLGVNPTKINLVNKKSDQYYVFDAAAQTLQTANLSAPAPVAFLQNVLSYQSYGDNVMLYASSKAATDGKVAIDLLQDGKTYLLKEVSGGSTYMLNLTQYSGKWYVAVGASSENKVYVYKNPVTQLNSALGTLVPIYVLKTPNPTYIAFSASAQFIMDESGSHFSVYDAEYDKGYQYDTKLPLDAPQAHASWMDGDRLQYVSSGKLNIFDFNNTNQQVLVASNASYLPFYSPDYKYLNLLAPSTTASQQILSRTPLRLPADL